MISFQASSATTLNSSIETCNLFWMSDIFCHKTGKKRKTLNMAPMLKAIASEPATVVETIMQIGSWYQRRNLFFDRESCTEIFTSSADGPRVSETSEAAGDKNQARVVTASAISSKWAIEAIYPP
uniref:Uncharacterized protein n=1 Tax=Romanomermis culicivorax TaxID=13658 RepID=A0A915J657_ROMCU